MLQVTTIQFLQQLKKNNSKPWFDANRKKYEVAKADFVQLVGTVIGQHGQFDSSIAELSPKECIFRINRDVRFSKDKSPYKTNMGASFNKGGKKSMGAGYYFHVEPGGESFVGGGIYMPMPDVLKKIRQEIDYNFDGFKKIIGHKDFKKVYGNMSMDKDMMLTRVPKDYEADNPAADFLKLKSFIAIAPVADKDLTEKTLVKKIITAFAALQPLVAFLNAGVEE
jgi:uncharacterized protein (TIGR02453 family)